MYIVDFTKRLFRKGNIGIIIYLILNTFLVMVLFNDILIGLLVYILSLVLALSPFGEWILRVQQGCKPLARKEHKERLMPLFNEVYQKARKIDPSIPDNVQLFINKDSSPNAFATGRKTVCINRGLLEFDDEEIKATLAHEFGHLSNKDTDLILVITIGNLIFTIMFVLYRIVFNIIGIMASIVNRSFSSLIITFFIDLILVGMIWIWTKIGTALVMHSSRQNEFEADHFALQCGYGNTLIKVIDRFNDIPVENTKGLWANLASTHPDPDQRIGKLQQSMELSQSV